MALGNGLRTRLGGLISASGPWRWALGAGLAWLVLVIAYAAAFLGGASGARGTVVLDALYFLVTLILPLMLIGLAAWLAEELARQRAALAALADLLPPLIGGLEAARDSLERHGPASPQAISQAVQAGLLAARPPSSPAAELAAPLERLAAGQAQIRAELHAALRSPPDRRPGAAPAAIEPAGPARRPRPARPQRPEPAALPPLPEAPAVALDWPDLIRALDFPRDADDRDGFRALKAALRHHGLAQMLQAAEDVLNLLSSVGVYMDDLEAAPADPASWRRFIAGTRGAGLASIGGITDPAALERAGELTRTDPIFRDTALYFQRRFDSVLNEFGQGAEDAQLLAIADTRSGRAFTLLARLGGSFD